jgi:hypothetical protein
MGKRAQILVPPLGTSNLQYKVLENLAALVEGILVLVLPQAECSVKKFYS